MEYLVIDRKEQKVVGTYQTLKRASRKVDKLDNEYGGYRYYHIRKDWYEEMKNTDYINYFNDISE